MRVAAAANKQTSAIVEAIHMSEQGTTKDLSMSKATNYGGVDLTRHPALQEAFRIACLIEACGASPELTKASCAAFDFIRTLDTALKEAPSDEIRQLFNKAVGVQKDNRFSFSLETDEEASRAFDYIADLGTL